jgi:hypothetical protein
MRIVFYFFFFLSFFLEFFFFGRPPLEKEKELLSSLDLFEEL